MSLERRETIAVPEPVERAPAGVPSREPTAPVKLPAGLVLEYPDYLARNAAAWEKWAAAYSVEPARAAWEDPDLRWGIWRRPESDLNVLDAVKADADVVELGCGTGSLCAGLARRGLKPVGVDIVRRQLETAAEFERAFGLHFPLLRANAERLHYGPNTFDAVVSDYGASVWCNPYRWIPEAYRLLRPQGLLAFLVSSPLLMTCTPDNGGGAQEQLVRDYFERFQLAFDGEDDAVEFHLTHERWIELLTSSGFVVWRVIETQPREVPSPPPPFAAAEWAKRWPTEEIWIARKRS